MLQTLLQNQPDRFKGHHDRYYSDQDAQRIPEEAADKAHQLISIRTRLLDREQEGTIMMRITTEVPYSSKKFGLSPFPEKRFSTYRAMAKITIAVKNKANRAKA